MHRKLEREIRKARPGLRQVSPLTFWIMSVLAVFNLLLGFSFMLAIDEERVSAPLIIVNDVFSFKYWGVSFLIVGALKFYALASNNWKWARKSLLLGVSLKAAWAVALVIRTLTSPGTVFLTLLWVAIALMQMGTYIWFMPPASGISYKQRKSEREDE